MSTQPIAAQVAPGVTQSAAHTANVSGTVSQSGGKPIVGADVRLSGPAVLSTKTDNHGSFSFRSVPWGVYKIAIVSSVGAAERDNIVLQGDIGVAIQLEARADLRTIANVSTSGAGAHINVTSSSIASVSPSDYAFQGNGTWTNLFAQVPGVAVSGDTAGGANYSGQMWNNPQAPQLLSLNGTLPYETSTTLDGMPLQATSYTQQVVYTGGGVDLSNLPINAFDTADVVRGPGANAPSIVDSIGGSFVLHPPEQVQANHFEVATGTDPYGGLISNAKVALKLDRLSATLIYGTNNSPGPLGNTTAMPGYSNTPATINGVAVQGSTAQYPSGKNGGPSCVCFVQNSLLYCCVPVSTEYTVNSGAAAFSYDVSKSIVAQLFYAGTTSRVPIQSGYFPVEFSPDTAASPPYAGNLHTSPPGQTTYNLLNVFPQLSSQSSNLFEEKITGYFNRSVLRVAALQYNAYTSEANQYTSFLNGTYKLWGTADLGAKAPGTPTAFNGTDESLTFPRNVTDIYSASNNRDLLFSYAFEAGPSSSAGISYVTSYYNNPYTQHFVFSGSPFTFQQASSVSETSYETRLHADTDIGKLSVGLSWYFAQAGYHLPSTSNANEYADTAFTYNAPRLGAVWRANSNIAIRASAGGGFALPAIYNLIGTPPFSSGKFYNQTLPDPNLRPEESFGYDIGTDVRLKRDTVFSFDLYDTNLYGQFFTANTLSSLNGLPLYLTQFGNFGKSTLYGLNLEVKHDPVTGYYWRGTLGLTRAYVDSLPAHFYDNPSVPCTNCTNQTILPGPNFNSAAGFLATVPYSGASAAVGYRWHPGRYVDLSGTYYGNNNIYYVPAFVALDAHAAYSFTSNISLRLTFRNITGQNDQSLSNYGQHYALPVIHGATGSWTVDQFASPYGPRSLLVNLDLKY